MDVQAGLASKLCPGQATYSSILANHFQLQ
jgi:hypothetical protein